MEILVEGYWASLILTEDPVDLEGQDPEENTEGSQLPNGSGTPEPTIDPDFEEVYNMILEENSNEIKEEKSNTSETSKGEVENDTRSGESSEIIPYLENISLQLGVIDIVVVLCLLLYIFKQFIRVPR